MVYKDLLATTLIQSNSSETPVFAYHARYVTWLSVTKILRKFRVFSPLHPASSGSYPSAIAASAHLVNGHHGFLRTHDVSSKLVFCDPLVHYLSVLFGIRNIMKGRALSRIMLEIFPLYALVVGGTSLVLAALMGMKFWSIWNKLGTFPTCSKDVFNVNP